MKQHISGVLLASLLFVGIAVPGTSRALSCLDPQSMIEYYVSEPGYTIFTGTAGEVKEYVKTKAVEGDPNGQYDSGYTAQHVVVHDAHKGFVDSELWVYYQKDSTWGYLCAGGPSEVGTKTLYIINQSDRMFGVVHVVNSYSADSTIARDILTALAAAESEGSVNEVTKENWQQRLQADLKEMIFVLRIKLSEWRWWSQ